MAPHRDQYAADMTPRKPLSRGIRNNNPLNIRIGNVWLGEIQNPTDPNFEQFQSMVYGLRAGFVLLRRYINHYHRTTIPQVISAWAPSSENNTVAYIDTVCRLSKIPAEATLNYFDEEMMVNLVDAMCQVECGQQISRDLIVKGYRFA